MTEGKLPRPLRRALSALETRLLTVFLLYGVGRTVALLCVLLLGLYTVDRLFEPPVVVRILLGLGALGVLARYAGQHLWRPLMRRPRRRDLAAILERTHPQLNDLLMTAVEHEQAPPGTSGALLQGVVERAELAVEQVDPVQAVPSGRARRSALLGLATAVAIVSLAVTLPGEARVFFQRLFGGSARWPQDTVLVLLPPHAEGHADLPEPADDGAEGYHLAVAHGTVLTLRVRAEGVVPDQVRARERGVSRPMRPLGGGEFVLRLPPLLEEREFRFFGGDDDDGLPRLTLEPGIAPGVRDWSVAVEPPDYTRRPPETSAGNEFRVPRGTRLVASFAADRPVASVKAVSLQGEEVPVTWNAELGRWSFETLADRSDEVQIHLEGEDGFRDARAAVLRWWAEPDRPPNLEFLLPADRWTTVPGGLLPCLVAAGDDYGLAEVEMKTVPESDSRALEVRPPGMELRHFELIAIPAETAELPQRFRLEARARDFAVPNHQQAEAYSPWLEVVDEATFEDRLADRMARTREVVERLLDRTRDILDAPEDDNVATVVRRVRRDLDGLQIDLERALLERVYSGIDPNREAVLEVVQPVLQGGAPAPGSVVAALGGAGSVQTLDLDRSGVLLDLARATAWSREKLAPELAQAVADGRDPVPTTRELQAQLERMLEILSDWQDFQSAVNAIRRLLDTQRNLYLRTRKASDS